MKDFYLALASSVVALVAGVAIGYKIANRKQLAEIEEWPEISPLNDFASVFGNIPFLPLGGPTEGPGAAYVVQLVSPEGQRLDISFSLEEWEMLHQVSEISGEPFEKVIIDVVLERKQNGTL